MCVFCLRVVDRRESFISLATFTRLRKERRKPREYFSGELFSPYKSPSETHSLPPWRFGCCHGDDLLPRGSGGVSFPHLSQCQKGSPERRVIAWKRAAVQVTDEGSSPGAKVSRVTPALITKKNLAFESENIKT